MWCFARFIKHEKHPWRSVTFKVAGLNFDTPPWAFFTFFKLHKWYQIAQHITYANAEKGKILKLNIDTNWIGVFFSSCRCFLQLKIFCRGFRQERYLLSKMHFVFQAWWGRKRQECGHHLPPSIQSEWLTIDDQKNSLASLCLASYLAANRLPKLEMKHCVYYSEVISVLMCVCVCVCVCVHVCVCVCGISLIYL